MTEIGEKNEIITTLEDFAGVMLDWGELRHIYLSAELITSGVVLA